MKVTITLVLLTILPTCATAGPCDYRPSQLIGGVVSTSLAVSSGTTFAAGMGLKAAGYYSLTHAITGLTMLGSTAAGPSAAGTVGIVAGTGGWIGSIGAVLLSPMLYLPAAITVAGISAYEGTCYMLEG